MTLRDYLWLGLVAVMFLMWTMPSTSAQSVVRGGGTSSLPSGIERDGIVWQFKTSSNGSFAPTIIGILTPPHPEPTLPAQSGALWVYCSGPTDAMTCALKVNVFGNPLELSKSTWSLQ